MKRGALIILIALVTVVGISSVFAAEGASIDKGKALFNDPKLGTTGKSCNTCHPDGQNIQKAGIRSDLEQIVNGCITHSIGQGPGPTVHRNAITYPLYQESWCQTTGSKKQTCCRMLITMLACHCLPIT